MDEQAKVAISYEGGSPSVMGRDLYNALGIATRYNDWFSRMVGYGFVEGKDFYSVLSKSNGGRPAEEHIMTVDMAKHIAMIQRNEKGMQVRNYFIEVEREWNSPEKVMARALQIANNQIIALRKENLALTTAVAAGNQIIAEMQPKATYYDKVLQCVDALPITVIAKDYGWSAKRMNAFLHEQGVQYKLGKTWILYQKYASRGYTETETYVYEGSNGNRCAVSTKWTQSGRLFIYELMIAHGYLPRMEQD